MEDEIRSGDLGKICGALGCRCPDGREPSARSDRVVASAASDAGLTIAAVRRDALAASEGATDFGAYFTYFSFFIVVSALLLALLFFRLGIEQRLRQIGILRASGFTIAHVRSLLIAEAVVLATIGAAVGMMAAVGYGQLMVYGLRTWWVGAVGTNRLTFRFSAIPLLIGASAGIVTAIVCVTVSLRAVARLSPRTLLHAQAIDSDRSISAPTRRLAIVKWICAPPHAVMLLAGFSGLGNRAGLFFGAAAVLLTAAMCQFSVVAACTRERRRLPLADGRCGGLVFEALRSDHLEAFYRPRSSPPPRSSSFRWMPSGKEARFQAICIPGPVALLCSVQSEVPLLASPNEAAGRETLVLNAPDFSRIRFARFRLRPGQDASCLNLYRPTTPTIIAAEPGFIEQGRFSFAASMARHRCRACQSVVTATPAGDRCGPGDRRCDVARVRAPRLGRRYVFDGRRAVIGRLSCSLSAP